MTTPTAPSWTHAALGILEVTGFTPAMVALDAMEKAGRIDLLQIEWNDLLGVCIKIAGETAAVAAAIEQGHALAKEMRGNPVAHVISRPDPITWDVIDSTEEFNPLIQQSVVIKLRSRTQLSPMTPSNDTISALGFIETQGFTAVFAAIDTACKAANVEVVGKEKLGGGYVTVVVRGDVAAVKAAIDAARPSVEGLGKLIAAHVIPRPSDSVLSLLPKV
jgi:microcompartment protein CcmL/EutN